MIIIDSLDYYFMDDAVVLRVVGDGFGREIKELKNCRIEPDAIEERCNVG
jgi:hypothetical protein